MRTICLGDLVRIIGGGTPDRSVSEYWGEEIPWVTVKDFKDIEISSAQESITELGLQSSASNLIKAGSILVPTRMALGKAAVNTVDVAINQDLKAIQILDSSLLDQRYLLRFLLSKSSYFESRGKGATVKGITLDVLRELPVPLPPLEEQKRIATILDKADSLRRKRAQAIALADDFLRSTFLELFGDPVTNPKGWPVAKLGDVTAFENGDRSSNYPSGDDLIESGVLFLSTKNIINKQLDLKFVQYISKEKFDSLSRGKPKFNDLIITLRGTLGNCCVYNLEDAAFINAQMMIIRPGPKVNSTFLQYFMTSNSINDLFQRIGQGAAVPQLTGKQLSELDVFVPEIDLQNAFESIVKKNNVLIGVMEKANVDLAKLGCMALV